MSREALLIVTEGELREVLGLPPDVRIELGNIARLKGAGQRLEILMFDGDGLPEHPREDMDLIPMCRTADGLRLMTEDEAAYADWNPGRCRVCGAEGRRVV